MPLKAKSQWDFGELFPPEATRRVLTVSELTTRVKGLLEREVGLVWVTGEITNFRAQSSGHLYFTLKDAGAQLSCVLFRGEKVAGRELLEDGLKVTANGELTVYEPRGQYQLIVRQLELQGVGALQLAFEKLKRKLAAEGLFAAERKRPLPRYPRRIGLVTSPTGAAIRDVLHVMQRRNPALEIILAPCRVQGEGAAAEIAAAIRLLNEFHGSALRVPRSALDLILITRGGGSLEDLWAFNEELVARAVFVSSVPVVSAIGHEIDFTISDFVADVRAATPSAAAELITEGVFSRREFVADAAGWLSRHVRRLVDDRRAELEQQTRRLSRLHPRRQLNDRLQQLDDLRAGLLRNARQGWRAGEALWRQAHQRLLSVRPAQLLSQHRHALREANRRLTEQARHTLQQLRSHLATADARLGLLSPANVLERGYSITREAATGRVVREAATVHQGVRLRTQLARGEIDSVVEPSPESAHRIRRVPAAPTSA